MVRFLADASLRHAIVSGCLRREPAIDFLSAHLAKLEGIPDPDVLAIAAEQGRILVTHDFRTNRVVRRASVSASWLHSGVIASADSTAEQTQPVHPRGFLLTALDAHQLRPRHIVYR